MKNLFVGLLTGGVIYLLLSFIIGDMDIMEWSWFPRFVIIFFTIILVVIYNIAKSIADDEDEQQQH